MASIADRSERNRREGNKRTRMGNDVRGEKRVRGMSGQTNKVTTISIKSLTQLKQNIKSIRRGWFSDVLRNDNSYTPSEHDKIKMNINLYLGQLMQFMTDDVSAQSALVLDSADLGTSVVLKAFGFETKNIHVPNWFKKTTEYNIMKDRVKDLSCFPVSVDDYVDAYVQSESPKKQKARTRLFQELLTDKYNETQYQEPPLLVRPLPERPDAFQFVYLDYCGKFHWKKKRAKNTRYSSDTVKDMFRGECFSKDTPFVFAVTGSFMMTKSTKINTKLKQYKNIIEKAAKNAGYKIRIDQYFVYNRAPQSGEADESIGYELNEDIPDDVPSNIKNGSKMFFMSFIGSYTESALAEWDSLFSQCENGACKLEIKHKDCLYQKGEYDKGGIFLSKPFCNYKITDFFIVTDKDASRDFEKVKELLKRFDALPWSEKNLEDRVDELQAANKRAGNHFKNGILKLFRGKGGGDNEMLDITELISYVNKQRTEQQIDGKYAETDCGKFTYRLDDVMDINYPYKREQVSIELIYGDLVGIHFVGSDQKFPDVKPTVDIEESCFIFHKEDLAKITIADTIENMVYEEPAVQKPKYKVGQEVLVKWGRNTYNGQIKTYKNGKYDVYFPDTNEVAWVEEKNISEKTSRRRVKRSNKLYLKF